MYLSCFWQEWACNTVMMVYCGDADYRIPSWYPAFAEQAWFSAMLMADYYLWKCRIDKLKYK